MGRASDNGEGNRPRDRAPQLLFLLGGVLPSLWGMWVVFVVGIGNSPILGAQPDYRYPREVPELWVTAAILTITGVALIWIASRRRKTSTIVFATLTLTAAAANWSILLLP